MPNTQGVAMTGACQVPSWRRTLELLRDASCCVHFAKVLAPLLARLEGFQDFVWFLAGAMDVAMFTQGRPTSTAVA